MSQIYIRARHVVNSTPASNLLRRHRPGKFRNSEASTPIADRNTADAICDLPLDRFRKRLVGGFGMRRQNAIFDPAPNLSNGMANPLGIARMTSHLFLRTVAKQNAAPSGTTLIEDR